jgi:hypothetical protein
MATTEAQRQLYQALEAHQSHLEITRSFPCGPDLDVLDRQIEAAQQLLEWLERALEIGPPASPAAQTLSSSTSPADQNQTQPSRGLKDWSNNLAAIRAALEAAGVEFTNGDQQGVRMRKPTKRSMD